MPAWPRAAPANRQTAVVSLDHLGRLLWVHAWHAARAWQPTEPTWLVAATAYQQHRACSTKPAKQQTEARAAIPEHDASKTKHVNESRQEAHLCQRLVGGDGAVLPQQLEAQPAETETLKQAQTPTSASGLSAAMVPSSGRRPIVLLISCSSVSEMNCGKVCAAEVVIGWGGDEHRAGRGAVLAPWIPTVAASAPQSSTQKTPECDTAAHRTERSLSAPEAARLFVGTQQRRGCRAHHCAG